MSRIAFVVPVYNVAGYLDECLESITSQALNDLEIICVNDGSTDESGDILRKWSARDARVSVIDKENGGPSAARNLGLDHVSSEFVCFPDADDKLLPEACETIVRTMTETGADVLTFGAELSDASLVPDWIKDCLNPRNVTYGDFSTAILFEEASRPFAWRCAFRTDFLRDNGIRFDEDLWLGEDQAFLFAAYPRSKKTVLSSRKLYYYRVVRSGSLMGKWRDNLGAKMSVHVDVIARILRDWKRGGFIDRYAPEMISFIMDFVMNDTLKLDDETYKKVASQLRDVLLSYWEEGDVEQMDLAPVLHDMVRACYRPVASSTDRKKLVFRYYAFRYGRRAAVRHALLSALNIAHS